MTASTRVTLRLISVDIPLTTNAVAVKALQCPSKLVEDPCLFLLRMRDTKRFLFQVQWRFPEVTRMSTDETALFSMGAAHWGDILITYRQGTAYHLGQYLAAQLIWPLSDAQMTPALPSPPISFHLELDKQVELGKPTKLVVKGFSTVQDLELIIETCVSDDFIALGTFPMVSRPRASNRNRSADYHDCFGVVGHCFNLTKKNWLAESSAFCYPLTRSFVAGQCVSGQTCALLLAQSD